MIRGVFHWLIGDHVTNLTGLDLHVDESFDDCIGVFSKCGGRRVINGNKRSESRNWYANERLECVNYLETTTWVVWGRPIWKLAPLEWTVALIGRKLETAFDCVGRLSDSSIFDLRHRKWTMRLIWCGHLMASMTWPTVGAAELKMNFKFFRWSRVQE